MATRKSNHDQFYEMFVDELRDLYSAENQIVEALPKMAQASTTKDLKEAFRAHLSETKNQVRRLEEIFSILGEQPSGEVCKGMQGLIAECEEVINHRHPDFIVDAELINKAQRIEHYEIAAYGTLKTFAHHLNFDQVEDLLDTTLDEESNANELLTSIAEGGWLTTGINAQAVQA